MVQIINPYGNQKTMGEDLFGLGGLTESFFGPKASTAAYTREKFKEQQRQNEATELVAQGIAQPGYDTGLLAGNAVRAGITPSNLFGMRSGVNISGLDPNALGTPANQGIITQNQLTIPGTAYSSTPLGMESTQRAHAASELARTDRIVRADELKNARELIQVHAPITPENPLGYATVPRAEFLANPGKYVQVAPSDIYKSAQAGAAFPTWADPNKLAYLGADVKPDSVFNWVAPPEMPGGLPRRGTTIDRTSDSITRQPIPAGSQFYSPGSQGGANAMTSATEPGKALDKDLTSSIHNANRALAITDQLLDIAETNPNAFNLPGNIRRGVQTGADLVGAAYSVFGGKQGYEQGVNDVKTRMVSTMGEARARALIPALWDKDLSSVQVLHGMLLYHAAAANGQTGRDASDKDIQNQKNQIGDVDSWTQGPSAARDRLTTFREQMALKRDGDMEIKKRGDISVNAPPTVRAPRSAAPSQTAPVAIDPQTEADIQRYLR